MVITVDRTDSLAQAVAITGGKITAVGTTAQIKAMAGANTEVIDLRGRAVTPGLIDSHVHFSAADALFTVDLGDAAVTSIEEVKKRVAAQVAKLKPGEWVRGRGWDEGKYSERRYITAADLDAVAPNNPVWLTHTTGHYGVANTYAMKMAEIRTATTADPPAGTIDRNAKGAPTGVMKESAMGLVSRLVPPLYARSTEAGDCPDRSRLQSRRHDRRERSRHRPGEVGALSGTAAEGTPHGARVRAVVRRPAARGSRGGDGTSEGQPAAGRLAADGMLVSGGVKMFMDGSGGARTAWMYEDWNKNLNEIDKGNTGYPSTDPAAYRQIVTELHNAGVHVSTHAIGDRAIDWVVDTYDQALARHSRRAACVTD